MPNTILNNFYGLERIQRFRYHNFRVAPCKLRFGTRAGPGVGRQVFKAKHQLLPEGRAADGYTASNRAPICSLMAYGSHLALSSVSISTNSTPTDKVRVLQLSRCSTPLRMSLARARSSARRGSSRRDGLEPAQLQRFQGIAGVRDSDADLARESLVVRQEEVLVQVLHLKAKLF